MKKFDVIIIGGGPAGVSAGIYALRAGVKVLVLDSGNSTLQQAKTIQNYYGIDNISGEELFIKGINQFKNLGGEIINQEVLKVVKNYQTNTFSVKTKSDVYEAMAVILAMGSPKKKTVKGLEKFEGANVSYCAVCDGFFYKNKTVAVLGDGDFALSECEELSNVAKKVYLISEKNINSEKSKNVEVINKIISNFQGDNLVSKIEFSDGSSVNVDGVFVAKGNLSPFELTKQLGLLVNNNFIEVDKNLMTNVAGVFCAGDMIGGLLQIVKAVSDGAVAGLEAVRYIKIMEMGKWVKKKWLMKKNRLK